MKKVFCFAVVAAVAAGAGTYLASRYAEVNPESAFGRCFRAGCGLAAHYDPTPRAVEAVLAGVNRFYPSLTRVKTVKAAPTASAPPEPTPDVCTRQKCLNFGPADIAALLDAAARAPKAADTKGTCPAGCRPSAAMASAPAEQDDTEESEPPCKTAPSCTTKAAGTPATMPYADDEKSGAADGQPDQTDEPLFRFYLGLFREAMDPAGETEESEPSYQEDPPAEEPDPAYHHQYPGCPYTGTCPYSGKCAPPEPGEEQETPDADEEHCPYCPGKGTGTTNRSSKKVEPQSDDSEDQECSEHQEIDTTEFRPSDARKGEFDIHPM